MDCIYISGYKYYFLRTFLFVLFLSCVSSGYGSDALLTEGVPDSSSAHSSSSVQTHSDLMFQLPATCAPNEDEYMLMQQYIQDTVTPEQLQQGIVQAAQKNLPCMMQHMLRLIHQGGHFYTSFRCIDQAVSILAARHPIISAGEGIAPALSLLLNCDYAHVFGHENVYSSYTLWNKAFSTAAGLNKDDLLQALIDCGALNKCTKDGWLWAASNAIRTQQPKTCEKVLNFEFLNQSDKSFYVAELMDDLIDDDPFDGYQLSDRTWGIIKFMFQGMMAQRSIIDERGKIDFIIKGVLSRMSLASCARMAMQFKKYPDHSGGYKYTHALSCYAATHAYASQDAYFMDNVQDVLHHIGNDFQKMQNQIALLCFHNMANYIRYYNQSVDVQIRGSDPSYTSENSPHKVLKELFKKMVMPFFSANLPEKLRLNAQNIEQSYVLFERMVLSSLEEDDFEFIINLIDIYPCYFSNDLMGKIDVKLHEWHARNQGDQAHVKKRRKRDSVIASIHASNAVFPHQTLYQRLFNFIQQYNDVRQQQEVRLSAQTLVVSGDQK